MNLPVVFGHRGASAIEPENTMIAFERAFHDGANGIEFDVRKTADNKLVLLHDSKINRTSNGSGKLSKKNYSELLNYDFGKGEKIPLLEDVLKKFGNKYWLNIEIKEVGFEKQLIDMLAKLKISNKYVVSSFKAKVLNKIKELSKEIPTAYLYYRKTSDLNRIVRKVTANDIHPGKRFTNKRLVENAHRLKMQVRVWTVDDEPTTIKLAEWGVDGIITNNPKEIIKFLENK